MKCATHFLQEKANANYLTINLDVLTKSKAHTPIYYKLSLFDSFHSTSKEKKKENLKTIGLTKIIVKSPTYNIRLTRKFKNYKSKINYNLPKSSFNKHVNNNLMKISTLNFNNIINVSECNQFYNNSSYKLKNDSLNKFISQKNLKTIV